VYFRQKSLVGRSVFVFVSAVWKRKDERMCAVRWGVYVPMRRVRNVGDRPMRRGNRG
jgi:hypothetical protein